MALSFERNPDGIRVNVGVGMFTFRNGHDLLWSFTSSQGKTSQVRLHVTSKSEKRYQSLLTAVMLEEEGPLRTTVRLAGELQGGGESLANVVLRVHCFAGLSTVRCEVTLHNPRKAEHPGGLWDLGSGGSIYLRDAALVLSHPEASHWTAGRLSLEPGQPALPFTSACELYQDSSGGENWDSRNHVNRDRQVPLTFRGYRVRRDTEVATGLRATPTLADAGRRRDARRGHADVLAELPQGDRSRPGEVVSAAVPEAVRRCARTAGRRAEDAHVLRSRSAATR